MSIKSVPSPPEVFTKPLVVRLPIFAIVGEVRVLLVRVCVPVIVTYGVRSTIPQLVLVPSVVRNLPALLVCVGMITTEQFDDPGVQLGSRDSPGLYGVAGGTAYTIVTE